MGFTSIEEVCDALLSSKALDCTKCEQLLQPPVMTIKACGNICHDCYQEFYRGTEPTEQTDPQNARSSSRSPGSASSRESLESSSSHLVGLVTSNPALDALLEKLHFSCDYPYCNDRIGVKDYCTHKQFCRYRVIDCELTSCEWKGMRKRYIDHYVKYHPVSVVEADSYEIADLKELNWQTDILRTSCGTFVSQIMLVRNIYTFVTRDIGHTQRLSDFKVFITFSQGSSTYSVQCNIAQSNQIWMNDSPCEMPVHINRKTLTNLFPNGSILIRWELKVYNEIGVGQNILTEFKCSTCDKSLTFPTYKCSSGNINTCSRCIRFKQSSPHVHTCSKNHVEDKALNALLSRVRHPCRFKDKGCRIESFSTVDHESTCTFNNNWMCHLCLKHFERFSMFDEHFDLIRHPSFVTSADVTVSNCGCKNDIMYVLRAFQRLFVIHHWCQNIKDTHMCKWSVTHMGPRCHRFVYEVEVFAKDRPWMSITLRNECAYNDKSPHWFHMDRLFIDTSLGIENGKYDFCVRIKPYRP